jgi:DNA-binding CsgD family transcriptional regulator
MTRADDERDLEILKAIEGGASSPEIARRFGMHPVSPGNIARKIMADLRASERGGT